MSVLRRRSTRRVVVYARKVVLLAGLLVFALSFSVTAPARATVPQSIDDSIGDLAEYFADETGAADLPCGQACGDLKGDLRRAPTVGGSDAVRGPLFRSFIDGRPAGGGGSAAPPLIDISRLMERSPWTRLGPYAVLVGANYYVWKYKVLGAKPRNFIIRTPKDVFEGGVEDVWDWVFSNGSETSRFPTFYEHPDPIVGVVAVADRAAVLWQTGSARCEENAPGSTPAYVQSFSWYWNRCFTGEYDTNGQPITEPLQAHGWYVSNDFMFALFPDLASWPNLDPAPTTFTTPTLTTAQIQERLRAIFGSDDPDYATLRSWVEAVLDGGHPAIPPTGPGDGGTDDPAKNPKDAYFTVPDCSGVTSAVCLTRLHDAGLHGTATVATLSSDDAVVELPADRVTDTEPSTGWQAQIDDPVTIYQNPATLPTLSATELILADSLDTLNDEITTQNKKTIARTCARTAVAAGRSISDCASLPILIQGRNIPTVARNEIVAQARVPAWGLLSRREQPSRGNPPWYDNRATPSPGCEASTRPAFNFSCDEFPFWGTMQAHGGSLNPLPETTSTVPGIRWAPRREQSRQGGLINRFNTKCAITQTPNASAVPVTGSVYLTFGLPPVAPLVDFPSMAVCNGQGAP